MIRPDIDEYFLKIASVVGERATCRRHHMGAVAVKDKHILTTGYNGAPAGQKDCLELGCLRDELGIPSGECFTEFSVPSHLIIMNIALVQSSFSSFLDVCRRIK